MSNLVERVQRYALEHGVEIIVVDGENQPRAFTLRAGELVVLFVDAGTAQSPHLSELVYRACEWAAGTERIDINIYRPIHTLLAS